MPMSAPGPGEGHRGDPRTASADKAGAAVVPLAELEAGQEGLQVRGEAGQLLNVQPGQPAQCVRSGPGEADPHHPAVLGVLVPADEPGGVGAVDQADGGVVAQKEVVGQLTDGRTASSSWCCVPVRPAARAWCSLQRRKPRRAVRNSRRRR